MTRWVNDACHAMLSQAVMLGIGRWLWGSKMQYVTHPVFHGITCLYKLYTVPVSARVLIRLAGDNWLDDWPFWLTQHLHLS